MSLVFGLGFRVTGGKGFWAGQTGFEVQGFKP